MSDKIVWLVVFIICLLGGSLILFGSLFIRFLYTLCPILGIITFILLCVIITNLIYYAVDENGNSLQMIKLEDKEINEKRKKNEP